MTLLPAHRRYIGRSVLLALLGAWVVLTGFNLLGALLGQVDDFNQGTYGLGHALLYVTLQVPRRAYENFAMAAVIGSVLGLGGLAARSELVAFRAAGLSPWRMVQSALLVVVVLALPLVVATESLAPWADQRAHALKLAATQTEVTLASGANVWAREGSEVFNARGGQRRVVDGKTQLVFEGVRVFAFDPQGRVSWIQEAAEAEYSEGAGWQLRDVKRTVFSARSVSVETFAQQAWETALLPGVIEASLLRPDHLRTAALGEQIAQLKRNGLDAGSLQDAYWSRWFFPFTALALVFAAAPFAFGQRRSGGFGMRLFVGIVFALVARLLQPMLVNLAKAYQTPIVLAYLVPVVLLIALGYVLLKRQDSA